MRNFFDKHETYFTAVYGVAYLIGIIIAFFDWIGSMFMVAQEGSILGFILLLFLKGLYVFISALIFAVIWGTVAALVLLIPYLVIEKLKGGDK